MSVDNQTDNSELEVVKARNKERTEIVAKIVGLDSKKVSEYLEHLDERVSIILDTRLLNFLVAEAVGNLVSMLKPEEDSPVDPDLAILIEQFNSAEVLTTNVAKVLDEIGLLRSFALILRHQNKDDSYLSVRNSLLNDLIAKCEMLDIDFSDVGITEEQVEEAGRVFRALGLMFKEQRRAELEAHGSVEELRRAKRAELLQQALGELVSKSVLPLNVLLSPLEDQKNMLGLVKPERLKAIYKMPAELSDEQKAFEIFLVANATGKDVGKFADLLLNTNNGQFLSL